MNLFMLIFEFGMKKLTSSSPSGFIESYIRPIKIKLYTYEKIIDYFTFFSCIDY